ncbi:MAG: hypothetical protein AB2L24_13355 [Mangrovibacterium sp.]
MAGNAGAGSSANKPAPQSERQREAPLKNRVLPKVLISVLNFRRKNSASPGMHHLVTTIRWCIVV